MAASHSFIVAVSYKQESVLYEQKKPWTGMMDPKTTEQLNHEMFDKNATDKWIQHC